MVATYEVEGIFDWRSVVHWSEEMVLEGQDNDLFKKFVAHQELFARSRDVSVSVLKSHTSESSLLELSSYVFV